MMTRWGDMDRSFAALDELRRRMDRLFSDFEGPRSAYAAWPRAGMWDEGQNLVLRADVPGLSEKDIKLTVNQDVLTLEGERRVDAPEGYSVHRRERAPVRFARSIALPCKVDLEKTTATVRDGVLTVTLAKAPEARPRQIAVQAR